MGQFDTEAIMHYRKFRHDYGKPGYGDSCTWGKAVGHPGDPRTDHEQIRRRIDMLTDTFGRQIRAKLSRDDDDDTTAQVADQLIRYLNDSEVAEIIRDAQRGRKENVFRTINRLIGESVDALAETRALEQFEAMQQPFSCPPSFNDARRIDGRA